MVPGVAECVPGVAEMGWCRGRFCRWCLALRCCSIARQSATRVLGGITMKAAVFREVNKPMEIEEIQVSKPGPREVLVRAGAVGVCHSDLHFFNGTYPGQLPIILGHEAAGVVEQVGSAVTYVKPGDHVITCLSVFCGTCEFCLTGHMSLCQEPALRRRSDQEPRLSKTMVAVLLLHALGTPRVCPIASCCHETGTARLSQGSRHLRPRPGACCPIPGRQGIRASVRHGP